MLSNEDFYAAIHDPRRRQIFCEEVLHSHGKEYAHDVRQVTYVSEPFTPNGVLSVLVPRLHPTYMRTSGGLLSRVNLPTRATITVFPEAFDIHHHHTIDDFITSMIGHECWYARSYREDPDLVAEILWENEQKNRARKLRAVLLATKNQVESLTPKNSPAYAYNVRQNLTRLEVVLLHIRYH